MAYISADEVKQMREAIKTAFPTYKWSITALHATTVNVSLIEADIPFKEGHTQVNPYYVNDHFGEYPEACAVLRKVLEIIHNLKPAIDRNAGDPYADYSDCNYYIRLEVGQWDKPYKMQKQTRRSTLPDIIML